MLMLRRSMLVRQRTDWVGSPAVPIPILPPELLGKIVNSAAERPRFDFLQMDWAKDVQADALKSLCLVSRTFNAFATPHLYSHPILPTAAAARAFLRTIGSGNWKTGERAGKAQAWVRRLTLGTEVRLGEESDGTFVVGVLDQLASSELEAVEMVGLKLSVDPFTGLTGECTLFPVVHLGH